MEEKRLATWGTDVPDDVVLDDKLLAEALKKVILVQPLVLFLLQTVLKFDTFIYLSSFVLFGRTRVSGCY